MRRPSTFLVCSFDQKLATERTAESVGVLSTESRSAPIYSEVLRLVTYYLSEYRRVIDLCKGQGIATIRDRNILSEWRRVEETLRPMALRKIAELPHEDRTIWFTVLYREQMQVCFVLNQQGKVNAHLLPQLAPLAIDVCRRRGKIASIVDQDPTRRHVRSVLRLSPQWSRYSLRTPSAVGKQVKGLKVVDKADASIAHPLVQKYLSLK